MEGGSFGKCAADATCGQQTVGVLAAAAAYFFGTGVSGLWPLAWIAPIPVLVLSYRSSARQSATIAFVAYVVANLNIASYLVRLAAPPAVIGAPVASAAPFLLAVLVQRYAILQGKDWSGVLAFPAAWTSYEFLMSLMAPDGTALNLAYSQAGALPLVTISDHLGRILAERASSGNGDVLLVGDVPLGPGDTPYSLAGDWCGATSVLLIGILLVMSAVRARRRTGR
jgi:apolipoprotein N-acyltransferase